jgi:hypothetical protein
MRTRAAGGLVGVIFGVTLSWTGMSSPEVLREALLLEHAYLYLFFVSAVATSTIGLWLLRRARVRALLTGEPVAWTRDAPRRHHVVGSVIFGVGWAVADACPARSPRRSVRACCGACSRSPASWPGSCCRSASGPQPARAPAGST